jgi:hypothetical protein
MQLTFKNNERFFRVKFIALYAFSIILITIAVYAFYTPMPFYSTATATDSFPQSREVERFLYLDNTLHKQHNELVRSYDELQSNRSDSNYIKNKQDSLYQAFANSINKFEKENLDLNSVGLSSVAANSVMASFRNSLKSLNFTPNTGNNESNAEYNNTEVIKNLTDGITTRDEKIYSLQAQLRKSTENTSRNTPEIVKKLRQENKFLANSLSDVVIENVKFTKEIAAQKQVIERLERQLDAFRKGSRQ